MKRFAGMRWFWLVGVFWLTGCASWLPDPVPTPIPESFIPTAIALTVEAAQQQLAQQQATLLAPSATPSPRPTALPTATPLPQATRTATPLPTPVSVTPSVTPSLGVIDLTPLADRPIPYAPVQILRPGAFSRLISPIEARLYVFPTSTRHVIIELLGEDGRLLARKLLLIPGVGDGPQTITTQIPFEISAVAELGLLRVSVDDAYQRSVSVNSVPVFLLSLGTNDPLPGSNLRAPVVIDQPRQAALVQGGRLVISALVRADEGDEARVRLVTRAGGVLVDLGVPTLPSAEPGYRTLAVEVPYTVPASTWARLSVEVVGARPHTVQYLSSVEVLLSP